MQDETYNGWKNYPTWCVNLWIGNERETDEQAAAIAKYSCVYADNYCEQVKDGTWTPAQAARYTTADRFKEWVTDELAPDLGASFAADLLGYALDEVDWYEIADVYIESVRSLNIARMPRP